LTLQGGCIAEAGFRLAAPQVQAKMIQFPL